MAESNRKKLKATWTAAAIVVTIAAAFVGAGSLKSNVNGAGAAAATPTSATATPTSATATPTASPTSSNVVSDADFSAASAALLSALVDRQRVSVPPNARLGEHPIAQEVQDLQKSRTAALSQRYTGAELGRMQEVVNRLPALLNAPDFQALDGGADSLAVTASRRINADSVELTGSARLWAKMAQLHKDGTTATASPSGVIQFVAVLHQLGNSWLLEDLNWHYAPGSEP